MEEARRDQLERVPMTVKEVEEAVRAEGLALARSGSARRTSTGFHNVRYDAASALAITVSLLCVLSQSDVAAVIT